jgi:hypothetical protein
MKKTNKENPLTFFRKANDARQKVVKNSLTKARNGIIAGPQTESQSILSNAISSQPAIPRPNRSSRDEMMEAMQASSRSNVDNVNQSFLNKYNPSKENVKLKEPRPTFLDPTDPLKKVNYDQKKIDDFNKKYPNGVPGPSSLKRNKKGGSVKIKK